ncbi:hypothetical protein SAMN05216436_1412 [bacterium A37T11]|nr:hypothetical protein SAMN05216436_1412 [bacterium A37T11]
MLKKHLITLFFLLTAVLLLAKPLVGFRLYQQSLNLDQDEYITIIKAFSKRKQEYSCDSSGEECTILMQQIKRRILSSIFNIIILSVFSFKVSDVLTSSILKKMNLLLTDSRWLYLSQRRLTI